MTVGNTCAGLVPYSIDLVVDGNKILVEFNDGKMSVFTCPWGAPTSQELYYWKLRTKEDLYDLCQKHNHTRLAARKK